MRNTTVYRGNNATQRIVLCRPGAYFTKPVCYSSIKPANYMGIVYCAMDNIAHHKAHKPGKSNKVNLVT